MNKTEIEEKLLFSAGICFLSGVICSDTRVKRNTCLLMFLFCGDISAYNAIHYFG